MFKLCRVVEFHRSMVNGGTSALGICAFWYMLNLFGVVVFHTSMVTWRRTGLVYVHSTICETYLVWGYSIHPWLIGGGTSALSICAFCNMLNLFGVVVFHRCMVNWRRGPWIDVHSAICETYLV